MSSYNQWRDNKVQVSLNPGGDIVEEPALYPPKTFIETHQGCATLSFFVIASNLLKISFYFLYQHYLITF